MKSVVHERHVANENLGTLLLRLKFEREKSVFKRGTG